MIGVLAVERSCPALGSHLCGMARMGTICGTLTQAQTGCPVLTFTQAAYYKRWCAWRCERA
jgi:hypothetical protein